MKTLDRPLPRSALTCADLTVETIQDAESLAAVAVEWDALFHAAEGSSLCANHAWVSAWWQAYGGRSDGAGEMTALYVLLFRDAGSVLVGAVPFVEDRPAHAWRVRRLRPLGFVDQNGVFDMTEEPTLLVRPGLEGRVLTLAAEALRSGLQAGRWDAVAFRIHAPQESTPLQSAFGGLKDLASLRIDRRGGSDYATLPETWAAYRKALGKSMRDNLGYYPRLLTRDGHDWSVRLLRDPADMAAAAARLAVLHRVRAESAKGRRHDAHLQGPVQEAFLAGSLRRFAQEGRATVGELLVDGRVVASQAFFESGDTMVVSYSGYEDEWYRYSPIFVIDSVVFRDALERGVRRLDFLRNPAPWKSRWLAAPGAPMHRARLVSRRPVARLRYALFWGEQAFRRNVTLRLPVIARDLRAVVERVVVPVAPVFLRLAPRTLPTLHLATLHLHHR